MNSKTEKKNSIKIQESDSPNLLSFKEETSQVIDDNIENLCDENLTTLQKIHSILLNCVNLSKKQKLEFCESERYFMKLYLKKLKNKS